ncbi:MULTISPECIES: response regulator [Natrialbaceae]|uniref:response regulator n=1 Tax=Natrialbaceae TaxID=1644061 RepID=UPI00207D0ABF|nr:response regulator [Natronococcus sp. CG52]
MDDIDILLVEDNHGDIHLVERAFDTRALTGTLHTVQTGDDALDWLHQRGEFADAPRPDLVLLDLNLPGTSGHTVLEESKSDPDLRRVPVIVLTSSRAEDDLIDAYDTHANACLIKPVDPEEFADRIQAFVEFWVTTATLPSTPGAH